MRKGYNPKLIFNSTGEIIGFSTGSDACAEHEQGSYEMQDVFCSDTPKVKNPDASLFSVFDKSLSSTEFYNLIQGKPMFGPYNVNQGNKALFERYFKNKVDIEFPNLLSRKRIKNNLDKISFSLTNDAEEPVAVMAFNTSSNYAQSNRLMSFSYREDPKDKHAHLIYGAWDCESFCFGVKSEELIKKFEVFANKAIAGGALFAGSFFESPGVIHGGVVVLLEEALTSENKVQIESAQRDYELSCLLSMRSDLLFDLHKQQLAIKASAKNAADPLGWSYLWLVWHPSLSEVMNSEGNSWHHNLRAKGVVPEVAIAINPCSSVSKNIAYFGPYDYQDVSDFINFKSNKLMPISKKLQLI